MSTVRVTYRKSAIGYAWDQKATLGASPSILGMVHKVRHLVAVNGEPADLPAGVALLRDLAAESESAA
jgi:ribosomal protein L30/L7E